MHYSGVASVQTQPARVAVSSVVGFSLPRAASSHRHALKLLPGRDTLAIVSVAWSCMGLDALHTVGKLLWVNQRLYDACFVNICKLHYVCFGDR